VGYDHGPVTPSRAFFLALIAAVAVTRLLELVRSRRNVAALRAKGGVETGPRLYVVMVTVHAALFVAPVVEILVLDRAFSLLTGGSALLAFAVGTAIRWHAITMLGASWTASAVVTERMKVCTRGLYRWIRHPNYLGVLIEVPALPLVHGAWISALVLGIANAIVVAVRIVQEEEALFRVPGYAEAMGGKKRVVPGVL
jgi:methyltransferase